MGILYLLAVLDKAMYSERDVENCLKLPVLVGLPYVSLPSQLIRIGDKATQF
jgi:capsular polysaccharide biosynthesis protein